MATSNTYSFQNTVAVVASPGGNFNIGYGAGVAKEGITIAMVEEKSTMAIGADGTPMHSIHAGKGGTITVRLLKTSPTNAQLMQLYTFTTTGGGANGGQDLISIRDPVRGDSTVAQQCQLKKQPDNVYAEEGPMLEWVWNAGIIDMILGDGTPG